MRNYKSESVQIFPWKAPLCAVIVATSLTGCVSDPHSPVVAKVADDVDIKIFLKPLSNEDPTLCPHDVDKHNPDVWRGKFVTWQTYVKTGGNEVKTDYRYEIFFDPIQGSPLKSNSKGELKRRIDGDAPPAEYKYTIWDQVTGQEDHKCVPLDPRFLVN